jgi:hypothetical protein
LNAKCELKKIFLAKEIWKKKLSKIRAKNFKFGPVLGRNLLKANLNFCVFVFGAFFVSGHENKKKEQSLMQKRTTM